MRKTITKIMPLSILLLITSPQHLLIAMENQKQPNFIRKAWDLIKHPFTQPKITESNSTNKKKRKRTEDYSKKPIIKKVKIIDLTTSPEKKIPSLHQIPSLQQNNTWICGYYATFNACKIFELINAPNNIAKLLNNINLNSYENDFRKFIELVTKNSDIKKQYEQNQWLVANDIENMLIIYFNQKGLGNLSNQNLFDTIKNISIFDMKISDGRPPYRIIGNYLLRNVENFQKQNQPQIVIINNNKHWVTNVITKTHIWIIDSLSKSRPLSTIEEHIYNYFINYKSEDTQTLKGYTSPLS